MVDYWNGEKCYQSNADIECNSTAMSITLLLCNIYIYINIEYHVKYCMFKKKLGWICVLAKNYVLIWSKSLN